jgi:hypothetical protein
MTFTDFVNIGFNVPDIAKALDLAVEGEDNAVIGDALNVPEPLNASWFGQALVNTLVPKLAEERKYNLRMKKRRVPAYLDIPAHIFAERRDGESGKKIWQFHNNDVIDLNDEEMLLMVGATYFFGGPGRTFYSEGVVTRGKFHTTVSQNFGLDI